MYGLHCSIEGAPLADGTDGITDKISPTEDESTNLFELEDIKSLVCVASAVSGDEGPPDGGVTAL